MLFLLRPRQTYMPYRLPRNRTQQGAYNRALQDRFDATRQTGAPAAAVAPARPDPLDQVQSLAALHEAGTLTDEEFAAAKARVLGS
jgi:Short C-terminal domain